MGDLAAYRDAWLGARFASRRKAPLLVQSVQLHPRLDRNGDRQISRDEIVQGVESLRQFDFDDDETLSPAELQPFPQSMLDAGMNSQTDDDRRDFVVLTDDEPLERLADRLIATYAKPEAAGLARSEEHTFELQSH